jgi:hypothetical protein
MTETLLELRRMVQLWSYTVGHKCLLLRATKEQGDGPRVDILFKGVGAIQVPTVMSDLVIREANDDERGAILRDTDPKRAFQRRCFILEGTGFRGWVLAGVMVSAEDDEAYDAPSPLLE